MTAPIYWDSANTSTPANRALIVIVLLMIVVDRHAAVDKHKPIKIATKAGS